MWSLAPTTFVGLREKMAFSPLFLIVSMFSGGIKQSLKAPGNESNRDLNIPNVRICKWNRNNIYWMLLKSMIKVFFTAAEQMLLTPFLHSELTKHPRDWGMFGIARRVLLRNAFKVHLGLKGINLKAFFLMICYGVDEWECGFCYDGVFLHLIWVTSLISLVNIPIQW